MGYGRRTSPSLRKGSWSLPEIVRLESNPSTGVMQAFAARHQGIPIGSVALPVRDHVNAATVTSLIMSDFSWVPKGKTVSFNIIQGSVLTQQRNECVNRMQGDWLLFIDDDMVWQPDAIERLITIREENDLDMVGGLCFRRAEPYQPTLFMRERPDEGLYNFLETWPENDVVEVDATGMAFMLIHQRVFEMIADGPMPPYEIRREMGGPPPNFFRWEGVLGEDLRFCRDAKAAGAKIWVATGIEIGHISEITVGHREFLTSIARRDSAALIARREINDRMGLPTMTPEEAKERLGW
jgi:hypothetical protein